MSHYCVWIDFSDRLLYDIELVVEIAASSRAIDLHANRDDYEKWFSATLAENEAGSDRLLRARLLQQPLTSCAAPSLPTSFSARVAENQ